MKQAKKMSCRDVPLLEPCGVRIFLKHSHDPRGRWWRSFHCLAAPAPSSPSSSPQPCGYLGSVGGFPEVCVEGGRG